MTFTHPCVTFISKRAQQLGANIAMAKIWFTATTIYTRSIGHEYAQVVQHCRLFNKLHINIKFKMPVCHLKGKFRHFPCMHHVNVFQLIILGVITVNDPHNIYPVH